MSFMCIMLVAAMDPENMEEFTFCGAFLVNALLFIVKVFVLMANQKKCQRMVEDMRQSCALLVAEFPEHRNLLDFRARLIHKITITIIVSMSVIYVGWITLPVLSVFDIVPGILITRGRNYNSQLI